MSNSIYSYACVRRITVVINVAEQFHLSFCCNGNDVNVTTLTFHVPKFKIVNFQHVGRLLFNLWLKLGVLFPLPLFLTCSLLFLFSLLLTRLGSPTQPPEVCLKVVWAYPPVDLSVESVANCCFGPCIRCAVSWP